MIRIRRVDVRLATSLLSHLFNVDRLTLRLWLVLYVSIRAERNAAGTQETGWVDSGQLG
jgi:hypothetical protein